MESRKPRINLTCVKITVFDGIYVLCKSTSSTSVQSKRINDKTETWSIKSNCS